MTVGMLWFDNSNTPLAEKVARAAAYHLKKYGRAPDLCLVHPSMMTEDAPLSINGANGSLITIRPYRSMLPVSISKMADQLNAEITAVTTETPKKNGRVKA